jgi:hypothetical protein
MAPGAGVPGAAAGVNDGNRLELTVGVPAE